MGRIWVLSDTACLGQRMPMAVLGWLRCQGHPTMLVIADGEHRLSKSSSLDGPRRAADPDTVWSGLEAGDLVISRGSSEQHWMLLKAAQARGATCFEDPDALATVGDPFSTLMTLEARGLWVSPILFARSPEDLAGVSAELFPLALSPMEGARTTRRRLARNRDELLALDWHPGGVVAQTQAATACSRLLVAGESVWALPLVNGRYVPARPETTVITPRQQALAEQCRSVLGVTLFSLDVADFGRGPVVVEVEAFPDYTGVPEAAAVIGRLLVDTSHEAGQDAQANRSDPRRASSDSNRRSG